MFTEDELKTLIQERTLTFEEALEHIAYGRVPEYIGTCLFGALRVSRDALSFTLRTCVV